MVLLYFFFILEFFRSRSPRPLVQQQEVLPQVPVRRCRLITSTPKRQSFGLCESTIPCYHSENEVCAEPESYWHPMMSNNAICTPQENYAKYACPSSPVRY